MKSTKPEERGSGLTLCTGGEVVFERTDFERKDYFLSDKRQREKTKKREKMSENPRLEIRSSYRAKTWDVGELKTEMCTSSRQTLASYTLCLRYNSSSSFLARTCL